MSFSSNELLKWTGVSVAVLALGIFMFIKEPIMLPSEIFSTICIVAGVAGLIIAISTAGKAEGTVAAVRMWALGAASCAAGLLFVLLGHSLFSWNVGVSLFLGGIGAIAFGIFVALR